MASFTDRLKALGRALKAIPFPKEGVSYPQVIFPDMNSMQAALLRAISPVNQPSDDPHLSALVAAGHAWLGSTLGEPDMEVMRPSPDDPEGDDEEIEPHKLTELFKRPNPYTSGSTLWKAFAYSWIISGNVYFLKIRNQFGQVVQLWYEPHFTVRARWQNDKQGDYIPAMLSQSVPSVRRDDSPAAFINYYELNRDGIRYRVERDDIVHFRDGVDPFQRRYGLSRLTTIFREIYADSAIASYAAQLLAGNGVIPYVLAIDDKEGLLSEADLANIKAKMIDQTTGENVGKPMVVTSRATIQKTGLTPQELDLRTSRYMAQETFAAVTGIPPQVLNFGAGLERSIYNNMSQADRRAVDQYLQPLWWHIAQELTAQLLPDFDTDTSHFVEFNLSEVGALQEDENEKWNRLGTAYQNQIIMRSEARTQLGLPLDPEGRDEVYLVRRGTETMTIEEEAQAQQLNALPVPWGATAAGGAGNAGMPNTAFGGVPQPQQIPSQAPQQLPDLNVVRKSLKDAPPTVREIYLARQTGQK